MALHPNFPQSPHVILDPDIRWFPADEALRESSADKLMPPLVPELRKQVQQWRNKGYTKATETSRSLLNWWFNAPHLLPQTDGTMAEFQHYFAQREALETIIYLYDVVGVKDKYDMMRFDHSGAVSTGMFDESWRRFVVKMATGTGKTKVMSLVLAWSYFHKLYGPDSQLARNFLVIAPNIIVLDRIYKDFQGLRIFLKDDPFLPSNGVDDRNWRDDFQLTLHVQDEVRITRPTGNIFLTKIHRVYAGDDIPASPDDDDTMDYFPVKRPSGATTDSKDAVLVIHTKSNGEISESTSGKSKEELDKLRLQATTIDDFDSPYKAIISVMVLKEAWDVPGKGIFIVETKGQTDLDVPLKMARLRQWSEDINRAQTKVKYDFVYVDQESFEKYRPKTFIDLVKGFVQYKT